MVKLRVFTSYYNKEQLDLFFAAFRLPDFVFEVLIVGSISSCFIPIISDILRTDKQKSNASAFSQSVSVFFLIMWVLVLIVIIPFYDRINALLLPGFSSSQVSQVSRMSLTILFFQVPFLLLGNIASAMLQNEKQFFIPGLAPVFYNLGIIGGVMLFGRQFGLQAAVYGVILGALLYFLIVFPGLFLLGYRFVAIISLRDAKIKQFLKLFVPRLFSSLVAQIDVTVDLALATLKGIGNYSPFYLAKNVQILPVSLFGIAIAQTALPFFADLYNEDKREELVDMFIKLSQQILFVMMPFVIFLTVLRIPVVRLLLGGDKFDWDATVLTANVLSLFALSLPFHTLYYVITRVFFAIHDTKTPLVTTIIFTVLNTVLSVVFIQVLNLSVAYLALSFSISITLNALVLFYILIKRFNHVRLFPFISTSISIFIIGFASALFVLITKNFLDGLIFDTTRTINLLFLTVTCSTIGVATYLYLAWIFVPVQLNSLISLFTRISFFKHVFYRYKKIVYTDEIANPLEEKNL